MELLLMPLTAMGLIFILAPFLALVPTVIFVFLYQRSKRGLALITASLWGIYTIYEYAMKLRILCSGECNIRVDLLLIYPLLIFISLLSVVSFVRWSRLARE
jgi:hypothetical protein